LHTTYRKQKHDLRTERSSRAILTTADWNNTITLCVMEFAEIVQQKVFQTTTENLERLKTIFNNYFLFVTTT